MDRVSLGDPAWLSTVPLRVAPHPDEWLPSLLLRCDQANRWASRTTLMHLLRPGPEKFHRCWRTETPDVRVIMPHSLNLDYLAQLLAISKEVLLATTYQRELERLYGEGGLHPAFLHRSFAFHLCPACLEEERVLRRILTLPHITLCPRHQIFLLHTCQCGSTLRLFPRQTPPFTCHACGRDWADLPHIDAPPGRLGAEQPYLDWYAFFFSQGSPALLQQARQRVIHLAATSVGKRETGAAARRNRKRLVRQAQWELTPLGTVVAQLVKHGLIQEDLLTDEPAVSPI